ncbi:MAG: hypothetical protein WKG07_33880 [Hymenobacter sp.]
MTFRVTEYGPKRNEYQRRRPAPDAPKPKLTKAAVPARPADFPLLCCPTAPSSSWAWCCWRSAAPRFMAVSVGGRASSWTPANGKACACCPAGLELDITRIALLLFCVIVFQGFFSFGRIWFFTPGERVHGARHPAGAVRQVRARCRFPSSRKTAWGPSPRASPPTWPRFRTRFR